MAVKHKELEKARFTRKEREFVFSIAMKYMKDEERAADVAQDAMMLAFQHRDSFRGDSRYTTWLYRITENVVRARLRKERLRRFFGFDGGTSTVGEEREVPSLRPSPEGDLEHRERARRLYAALDRIAEIYRNPFILFELEGLPGEEVARLVGVKLPTLWVRLSRAREQVAAELERQERGAARAGLGT